MAHTNKPKQYELPRERIDCSITRDRLIKILKDDAIHYERSMPDVPLEALCTGHFLHERGYMPVGNTRLLKRETNGKLYLFLAVREVESNTVTAAQNHPVYELEAIS